MNDIALRAWCLDRAIEMVGNGQPAHLVLERLWLTGEGGKPMVN